MLIEWDLDPEITTLFGVLPIRYYSLLFGTGLMLGYLIVRNIFVREKLPIEYTDKLIVYIFIGTVLGARLGHCLFYEPDYYLSRPLEMLLPFKIDENGFQYTGFLGLASHGGIIGVFFSILYFCRKTKMTLFSVLDKVAIGGAITAVFIRLGNFMNSEILGKATGGNYGVIFKRVDNLARHPAQLYEAFAYLFIFILIYFLYKKKDGKREDGFIFGVFFTFLFVARFLIEFFKINQVDFEDGMLINMGQILSIPFFLIGLGVMIWKRKPKTT